MNTPIKLPSMTKSEPTIILEYHLTLSDDTVVVKNLKEVITELGQPTITLFTDATFTLDRQPIVYKKGETEWEEMFKFVACEIKEIAAKGKGDK